jgi:hypothetical protein
MGETQALLLVGLTAVAALQRFAVAYGYEGKSWQDALESARYAAIGVGLLAGGLILLSNSGGQ